MNCSEDLLEQWWNDANNGQRDPMQSDRGRIFNLINEVRSLRAEVESKSDLVAKMADELWALSEAHDAVAAELERSRVLCVELESEISDMSLARYGDVNAVRFIPMLGYPDGDGLEIDRLISELPSDTGASL